MIQSCSTFTIKYFWQFLNMICSFAKLIVVDPYMLCNCSCLGQLHKHSILLQVCFVCHALLCSESIKLTKRPIYYYFCHALFSAKSGTCYVFHFCHACLSLLCCEIAVSQCSSFVKHLLQITTICFVAMLECCSIVACCILSAIMLLIADSCHSCFARHLRFR